jgi:hypothetical protein
MTRTLADSEWTRTRSNLNCCSSVLPSLSVAFNDSLSHCCDDSAKSYLQMPQLSEIPVEVLIDNLLPCMQIVDVLQLGCTNKVIHIGRKMNPSASLIVSTVIRNSLF